MFMHAMSVTYIMLWLIPRTLIRHGLKNVYCMTGPVVGPLVSKSMDSRRTTAHNVSGAEPGQHVLAVMSVTGHCVEDV